LPSSRGLCLSAWTDFSLAQDLDREEEVWDCKWTEPERKPERELERLLPRDNGAAEPGEMRDIFEIWRNRIIKSQHQNQITRAGLQFKTREIQSQYNFRQ